LASDTRSSKFLPSNGGSGFDIVIMSDLLHFGSSHATLVESLAALLAKSGGSRAYIAAGKYTKQDVCDRFIDQARHAGIVLVEQSCQQVGWQGKMAVRGPGLDREGLRRRRDMSRLWVGRWMGRMAE
jgi:nicotinamide N-methyltransferase